LRKGAALLAGLGLEARVVGQGICSLVDPGLQCLSFRLDRVCNRRIDSKVEKNRQGTGQQSEHCRAT